MASINHTSRNRLSLAASSATRWLTCTPSVLMVSKIPKPKSTSYAAEGTLAHEFAELMLSYELGRKETKYYRRELEELRQHELYTKEMEPQARKYVDYCLEVWAAKVARHETAEIKIEHRVDFSDLVPRGYSIIDALLLSDECIDVIDLKYGKGVPVSAVDNDQLKLYALGALWANRLYYDVHWIKLHIVQPRLDNISTFEMRSTELIEWARDYVAPQVRKALAGEGELVVGDHCRWCRAKPKCKAYADLMQQTLDADFGEPGRTISDEQVLALYEKAPLISAWIKAAGEYLLNEALAGKQLPGYKVVEGRSSRRWANPLEVERRLRAYGLDGSDILTSKLKGLGDIGNLMSKDRFKELLGDLVERPQGKPTLAPLSDKRKPFADSALDADFGDS